MLKKNVGSKSNSAMPAHVFNFAAVDGTVGLYVLNPKASSSDIHVHLQGKLSQLCAMLALACGDGYDPFSGWGDEEKESYRWACKSIANECQELTSILISRGVING